jgi:hypothetical protein
MAFWHRDNRCTLFCADCHNVNQLQHFQSDHHQECGRTSNLTLRAYAPPLAQPRRYSRF